MCLVVRVTVRRRLPFVPPPTAMAPELWQVGRSCHILKFKGKTIMVVVLSLSLSLSLSLFGSPLVSIYISATAARLRRPPSLHWHIFPAVL